MKELYTRKFGNNIFIEKPAGKRITAGKLEEGKSYLYKGLYKYKTIIQIAGDRLTYEEFSGCGVCSKSHFARTCPNELTEDEKEFLDSYEN